MKQPAYYILLMICLPICVQAAVTLDLQEALTRYAMTADGYWTETYTRDTCLEQGLFRFSHTGSLNAGMGMAYWDGFTLCTNSENIDYAQGSSDAWVLHQWGCMAGGGLTDQLSVEQGQPYMLAYWGYKEEQLDETFHSLQIDFTDDLPHKAIGVYVCNHPWPYYGIIKGDGFAQAFKNEGDKFSLIAHGLNEYGEPTGTTATHTLAQFTNGELKQSDSWEYFDLTALGTVSGIYFTMQTTDEDALYGANTAVYFCLDRLRVAAYGEDTPPLSRPNHLLIENADEQTITLSWEKVEGATSYILLIDGNKVGESTDNTFIFTHLQPYTEYALSVIAVCGDQHSDTATINASTTDDTAPDMPTLLTAEAAEYSIALSWQPANDNVGVSKYTIWLDGVILKRTAETTYTVTGLNPSTEYLVEVAAQDEAGNVSSKAALNVKTLDPTALPQTTDDNAIRAVFTIDGRCIGSNLPRTQGIYIIQYKK